MSVVEPGVYPDMPHAEYLADPVPAGSLSSSGARAILSSPARFRWGQAHPRHSDAFDLGTAVHTLVLGTGLGIVVVDADSWRTNAAREARDEARENGQVPLLAKDAEETKAMAEAVLAHRTARLLIEQPGLREASMFGVDPVTGEWLRARPDVLPMPKKGRPILVDLKTSRSADPEKFARSAGDFGYQQQHAFYVDADALIHGDRGAALVFVVVEVEPPYLVSVVELDEEAIDDGRDRNRAAINLWHSCRLTGEWPGYGEDVHRVSLPPYILNRKVPA